MDHRNGTAAASTAIKGSSCAWCTPYARPLARPGSRLWRTNRRWVLEVAKSLSHAAQRGEKEVKEAQLRVFLAAVTDDSGEREEQVPNSQVLPHGTWRLDATVLACRDMEKQDPVRL